MVGNGMGAQYDMSGYAIIVTRADGRLQPVTLKDPDFEAVCRQAFRFAQNAAIHGCPLGDALPPRWVDIRRDDGDLILRITVDAMLKPIDGGFE
jgi:hypothetical protein